MRCKNNILQDDEDYEYWIDAAGFGDWKRHINHSCDPDTSFEGVCIGQQLLIVAQAAKDICFGDELTLWYSEPYFDD